MRRLRRKAYVDLDPGFTQFWHAAGMPEPASTGHDSYFTVGENIGTEAARSRPAASTGARCGRPSCSTSGRSPSDARPRPLHDHRDAGAAPSAPIELEGRTLRPEGARVPQDDRAADARRRARSRSRSTSIPATPRTWRRCGPTAGGSSTRGRRLAARRVPPLRAGLRRRVLGRAGRSTSDTASGWFSDRTVRYLASGKPALVQDTGFAATIRSARGWSHSATLEEAVAGAERIARDYEAHSEARARARRASTSTRTRCWPTSSPARECLSWRSIGRAAPSVETGPPSRPALGRSACTRW